MATGTIVKVWQDGQHAHAAVNVAEGGQRGNVEYVGRVPLVGDLAAFGFAAQEWSALTNAQKKTALQNAVKAERDARIAASVDVSGITGTVTI